MKIKIVKQKEAVDLLNSQFFIDQWEKLVEQTSHVTAQQNIGFVKVWYKEYLQYDPVLVVGYDNSDLIGLMFLAYDPAANRLTHCGDKQSEYHGWLAKKTFEEKFLIESMILQKENYSTAKLSWRWLPPRADVDWLNSDLLKKAGIYSILETYNSPLLDVTDIEFMDKIRKNKSLKSKINRYKRAGDFRIERIKTYERAEKIFNQLEYQCNFRHLAIHNSIPFVSDHKKRNLHINLLAYPNQSHFTVLWSNDKPIAFQIGESDETTVYLGVTGFDPRESKNSPGALLIIKLAELLYEEGYKCFDLTPGGDKYKEAFRNDSQNLVMPQFYFNRSEYLKANVKLKIKNWLKKWFKNSIKLIREKTDGKSKKKDLIVTNPNMYHLSMKEDFVEETSKTISINKYEDLLLLDASQDKLVSILSDALNSFTIEETVITIVENGVLYAYFWLTKATKIPRSLSKFALEDPTMDASILYNIYVKDENPDYFDKILKGFISTNKDKSIILWKEDHSKAIIEASEILKLVSMEKIAVKQKE